MDSQELYERRGRLLIGAFGFLLFALVVLASLEFLASLVFAVFLYYSTRPVYRRLGWVPLPRRIRAALTLVLFGIPFIALLLYTLSLAITEATVFIERYDIAQTIDGLLGNVSGISSPLTVEGFLGAYEDQNYKQLVDTVLQQASTIVSFLGNFLLRLAVVVAVTYYLLVDGHRLKEWILTNYDDDGVLRRYAHAVDDELSVILFGNILNAFLTAIIGIAVYSTYNVFAPSVVEVPYPALVGALTGVGSLIPVVGMKIVYYPVAAVMAVSAFLADQTFALAYVVGFMAVSFVIVDLIPDFVLRPFVSGRRTHVGLLMFAYLFGPFVFGFYGIFLGPIVLVLFINFVRIPLPYVLKGVPPTRQSDLDEFRGG